MTSHRIDAPIGRLLWSLHRNHRKVRTWAGKYSLSLSWRDKSGATCAAFEMHDGISPYCVVYRGLIPYDNWVNTPEPFCALATLTAA